ncbi:hypothetical protein GCM10007392_44330 [Saccharospirillum salsuginis]|uniref:Uncharacterized protein n=1 Tax=Saccharospirillum salsuginis TaxID=418750 RepID=A0A918NJH3_9GAMM|nr:hypothetical protein GCM10007392_44330 [Saccharospirillum salsuginis]
MFLLSYSLCWAGLVAEKPHRLGGVLMRGRRKYADASDRPVGLTAASLLRTSPHKHPTHPALTDNATAHEGG